MGSIQPNILGFYLQISLEIYLDVDQHYTHF